MPRRRPEFNESYHGYKGFAALLDESHRSLRDDYEVSIPEIDRMVALGA